MRRQIPKLDVAGSTPVARSLRKLCRVRRFLRPTRARSNRRPTSDTGRQKRSRVRRRRAAREGEGGVSFQPPNGICANHSDEATMKRSGAGQEGESASQLISKRIAELGDWRGETLGRIRALIKEADPAILEEWKWMGTPVWSHNGIVCTGETYKNVVKMTFSKGASLKDPSRLFNSSLDGNARRAIDIHEGEEIDAPALKALIRAAVALNVSGRKAAPPKRGEG